MSARRLTEPESDHAVAALQRVVEDINPFDFVPAPEMAARLVTVGPFHLRPAEYSALDQIVAGSQALLANLDADGRLYTPSIWEVSTSDYPFERLKSDAAWNGIGSSVLWSHDGVWAVVVSNEGHGVVAGPLSFVAQLQDRLPHGGDALLEIAKRLYVGTCEALDADERLVRMMARLYGDNETQRVVADLGGA